MDEITSINVHKFHLFLAHKIDRAKLEKEIRDNTGNKKTTRF